MSSVFKSYIAFGMAILWALAANHCLIEDCFAHDFAKNPVHHEGEDSHSHGQPCHVATTTLKDASEFSKYSLLNLDGADLNFVTTFSSEVSLANLKVSKIYLVSNASFKSMAAKFLVLSPNAPPVIL